MADGECTPMDHTNSKETEAENPVEIPGGKKIKLSEEPQPPAQSSATDMGCGPGKSSAVSDDENDNAVQGTKPTANSKQNKKSDRAQENINDKKNSKPKSPDPVQPMSEDDDNENRPSSRSSGRVTRSSAGLSKLTIVFNNSDDEDSSYMTWSKRDIVEYRSNYPGSQQDKKVNDNFKFYTNKISSYPDGDYIDNIHKNWRGDYRKLEIHHGYIQWLFPIQEQGLNWSAEKLQKHEIESIKRDQKALKRLLESYKLMLDFYGFELVDEQTGEIRRSKGNTYVARFDNLNFSSHNYLRITRMLKCLGEFDYEYLKFPFLERILYESIIEDTLPNCLRSCKDYWIETLRSQEERRAIRAYANELLDYRHKGIKPPKAFRAERPKSSTTKQRQATPVKARVRSAENLC